MPIAEDVRVEDVQVDIRRASDVNPVLSQPIPKDSLPYILQPY